MRVSKHILIVEDEPKIRGLLCRCLKEEGFFALEAEDGQKALNLIQMLNNVDLIILDIRLPKFSGLDIYDVIKKEFPRIKIVVSSVYTIEEQEFLIADADDYYYKSESVSVLVEKINRLLTAPNQPCRKEVRNGMG